MMVAMMVPSLALILWRERLGRLAVLVAAAYLFVWAMIGAVLSPLAMAVMGIPSSVMAIVVLAAAAYQLVVHQMSDRRRAKPVDAGSALRYGLRLGLNCTWCCAGYMTMLMVMGMMDLRAVAVVTTAITVQRANQM